MARLTIVNPIAEAEVDRIEAERVPPAPRPRSLDGATIGLFWNGKQQGDVGLAHTRARLDQAFEKLQFVEIFGEKGGLNRYASPEQLDDMSRQCDAVVLATAD